MLVTAILLFSLASEPVSCRGESIVAELIERKNQDQIARQDLIDSKFAKDKATAIVEMDKANTAWLRAWVTKCGWPKRSEIGEEAELGAWLIAQHADVTPDFQVEAAAAMKKSVLEHEASGSRLALLVDRNRRLQKKPQVYGMQFDIVDGKMIFLRVEQPDQLDARREEIGLDAFACYVRSNEKERNVQAEWPSGVPKSECGNPK